MPGGKAFVTSVTPVVSGGGGLIHAGVYDGDQAGWHPACGEDRAHRWFTVQQPVNCPRCLPSSTRNLLAITDDIADQLETVTSGTVKDPWALVEDAARRLRQLHDLTWLP